MSTDPSRVYLPRLGACGVAAQGYRDRSRQSARMSRRSLSRKVDCAVRLANSPVDRSTILSRNGAQPDDPFCTGWETPPRPARRSRSNRPGRVLRSVPRRSPQQALEVCTCLRNEAGAQKVPTRPIRTSMPSTPLVLHGGRGYREPPTVMLKEPGQFSATGPAGLPGVQQGMPGPTLEV